MDGSNPIGYNSQQITPRPAPTPSPNLPPNHNLSEIIATNTTNTQPTPSITERSFTIYSSRMEPSEILQLEQILESWRTETGLGNENLVRVAVCNLIKNYCNYPTPTLYLSLQNISTRVQPKPTHGLTSLPDIFHLNIFKDNVARLDLSRNLLQTLPPSIANLKNLNFIDLNQNRLTDIPDPITKLKYLRLLYSTKTP